MDVDEGKGHTHVTHACTHPSEQTVGVRAHCERGRSVGESGEPGPEK